MLVGNDTFDDLAFELGERAGLEPGDAGKELIDEAVFPAASPEARDPPGYLGRT